MFESALYARNCSPRTIKSYLATIRIFKAWHGDHLVDEISAHDIDAFSKIQMQSGLAASTVATRWRHLQQFFRWLVESEFLATSPLSRLSPPKVIEGPIPVLSTSEIAMLLETCRSESFRDARDGAIIQFLADTGCRLGETVTMRVTDVHVRYLTAVVMGKGRHQRRVAFGAATARALASYLGYRSSHESATDPALWLGLQGPMTESGVYQVIRRRAKMVGLADVHPHRFRHTFAHRWLSAGGSETDLLTLAGWRSTEMLNRYGASARTERAIAARHRLRLGESWI